MFPAADSQRELIQLSTPTWQAIIKSKISQIAYYSPAKTKGKAIDVRPSEIKTSTSTDRTAALVEWFDSEIGERCRFQIVRCLTSITVTGFLMKLLTLKKVYLGFNRRF